jgi:putative addiction module component (TIGR02574 family)
MERARGRSVPNVEPVHASLKERSMTESLADLTHAVLDLEKPEREQLIEALLASFDREDEIDRAWMEEVRRRWDAIRSGAARTFSHDEVVARLEARYG